MTNKNMKEKIKSENFIVYGVMVLVYMPTECIGNYKYSTKTVTRRT